MQLYEIELREKAQIYPAIADCDIDRPSRNASDRTRTHDKAETMTLIINIAHVLAPARKVAPKRANPNPGPTKIKLSSFVGRPSRKYCATSMKYLESANIPQYSSAVKFCETRARKMTRIEMLTRNTIHADLIKLNITRVAADSLVWYSENGGRSVNR